MRNSIWFYKLERNQLPYLRRPQVSTYPSTLKILTQLLARQFIPPSGQSFTNLAVLKKSYHNEWAPLKNDGRFWNIWTEPRFGIGQRAILIRTPEGNILWDCIALIDSATIEWIKSIGGLAGIVISHPHYYTTHVSWAEAFDCPVYMSSEDQIWLNRNDRNRMRTFVESESMEIEVRGKKTGVQAIKLGGHFPGSCKCDILGSNITYFGCFMS